MSVLRLCGRLGVRQLASGQNATAALAASQSLLLRSSGASSVNSIGTQRGHKRFGHEQTKTPKLTKFFHFVICGLFILSTLDYRKIKRMMQETFVPKVDALEVTKNGTKEGERKSKSSDDENGDSSSDESSDDESEMEKKKIKEKKDKVGFRERKIIEYENRIRQYSSPDKIFRYFATVRLTTGSGSEICMTPDDFLRSIYPGMRQPDGLGLDQYRRYDPKSVGEQLDLHLNENSIFYKLGSYGLITFSDYIFLLTVLSTSRRHFEIAFQMFDLNGDGDVDCEEFAKVATLIRQQTSVGSRHRDHASTGSTFRPAKGVNSALTTYFFGPNLDQKLTIEKFLDFQYQLQREILSLEFERKKPNDNGLITEADFAELLLAYAGYTPKKKQRKLKRVKRRYRNHSQGISKDDYLDFSHFLNNINDVDTALTFYHIAGASIDQDTLKHVAKTVAMVDLSDHVIDIVFTIFDEDDDNQLSNREFVAVLKNRLHRGLEKSKDTGFVKMMRSMLKCAKDTKPVLLDF